MAAIKRLLSWLSKHKVVVIYAIVGVATTIVSFASYFLFRVLFPTTDSVVYPFKFFYSESITLFPSILSWICAVTFAYIFNKILVFKSKAHSFKANLLELLLFYGSRLLTLLIDSLILFIFVDCLGITSKLYELAIKVMSNIVIAILNYFLGKFVFKNKRD